MVQKMVLRGRCLGAALIAIGVPCASALAQSAPAAAPNPVVAIVDGKPIHLSDLDDAASSVPQAESMPRQMLYPMLLDQLIAGQALIAQAHRTGLENDPAVQKQMKAAEDRALETAMLHKQIDPQITDAAIKERYEQDIANKSGEKEVHARHILVADEATAKKIIAQLKGGGDFAALSKQYSKDPGAAQQGGDLGFFKKSDMVPEFADAAFQLKPGEVSPTPVHTQFGWHVIQVLEVRDAKPPSFEEARSGLRQKMIQESVQKAIAQAESEVTIQKFNLDGSPPRATDNAQPPSSK